MAEASNPRDHWKSRSAGWTLTAATAEPRDDYFDRALIEAAGIKPGHHVIDLASGTGDPSILIAKTLRQAGAGQVTACDLTYEMLTMAQQRAVYLEFNNLEFSIADMTALPFADNSFDSGTCRLGLMFPDDKVACAMEARRVLKPGARIAYLCWAAIEKNPAFGMFAASAKAYFGRDFPPRMARHSLGAPGQVAAVLDAAGFPEMTEDEITYDRVVEPGDGYFRFGISRAWPDAVADLDDQGWAALLRITEETFSPFKKNGKFHIPQCAILGVGTADG